MTGIESIGCQTGVCYVVNMSDKT